MGSSKFLSPKLGFLLMLGIGLGAVIGPWLVQMSWWFSLAGPSLILALIATAILLIPVSICYGELAAMLPFAGGEFTYAHSAYGGKVAWWVGWFTLLLYVIAVAFMSAAVVRIFQAIVYPDMSYKLLILIAIGVALVFTLINVYSIRIAAWLQAAMVAALIIIGLIIAIVFLTSQHWTIENYKPFFATGGKGWFMAVGMMVIMYTGFDAIVQMTEEAHYPKRRHVWVMIASIVCTMIFYIIIVGGNAGMKPTSWLSEQLLVSATIAREHWGVVPYAFIAIAAICATLTCLNAFLIAGVRISFAIARAGWLPRWLAHVSKRDVPDNATWFIFAISMLILIISGERWLDTSMIVASLACGIVYTLIPLATLVLRKTHPEWPRPYKIPGTWTGVLAVIFGIIIFIAVLTGITPVGWLVILIYVAIGLGIFGWMLYQHSADAALREIAVPLTPQDIPEEA